MFADVSPLSGRSLLPGRTGLGGRDLFNNYCTAEQGGSHINDGWLLLFFFVVVLSSSMLCFG